MRRLEESKSSFSETISRKKKTSVAWVTELGRVGPNANEPLSVHDSLEIVGRFLRSK